MFVSCFCFKYENDVVHTDNSERLTHTHTQREREKKPTKNQNQNKNNETETKRKQFAYGMKGREGERKRDKFGITVQNSLFYRFECELEIL